MRSLVIALVYAFLGLSFAPFPSHSAALPLDQYGAYIYMNYTYLGNVENYSTSDSTTLTQELKDSYDTGYVTESFIYEGGEIVGVNLGRSVASASLYSGQIRAQADCGMSNCFVESYLSDVLLFDLSGVTSPFDVTFSAHVDGTYGSFLNFSTYISNGYNVVGTTALYRGSGSISNPDSVTFTNTNEVGGAFDTFGPDFFVGHITVDPAVYSAYSGDVGFLTLSYGITGGWSFDLSNTIGFSISSPVPYSSASGVFLTELPVTPVPLPTSLASLAIGFGLLSGLAFLRRQRFSSIVEPKC